MEIDLDGLKKTLKTFKVRIVKETDKAIVILAGNGVYLTRLPSKNGVKKRVISVPLRPKLLNIKPAEEIIDPGLFGCVAEPGNGLNIIIRTLSDISSGDSQKSPSSW